jgi:hypothetical protein
MIRIMVEIVIVHFKLSVKMFTVALALYFMLFYWQVPRKLECSQRKDLYPTVKAS